MSDDPPPPPWLRALAGPWPTDDLGLGARAAAFPSALRAWREADDPVLLVWLAMRLAADDPARLRATLAAAATCGGRLVAKVPSVRLRPALGWRALTKWAASGRHAPLAHARRSAELDALVATALAQLSEAAWRVERLPSSPPAALRQAGVAAHLAALALQDVDRALKHYHGEWFGARFGVAGAGEALRRSLGEEAARIERDLAASAP
ncbi:MAG: hypothetical protein U0324_41960 [Polyangiales bacterium]